MTEFEPEADHLMGKKAVTMATWPAERHDEDFKDGDGIDDLDTDFSGEREPAGTVAGRLRGSSP